MVSLTCTWLITVDKISLTCTPLITVDMNVIRFYWSGHILFTNTLYIKNCSNAFWWYCHFFYSLPKNQQPVYLWVHVWMHVLFVNTWNNESSGIRFDCLDNYHVSLKKYEEKIYIVYDEGNWRSFMKVIWLCIQQRWKALTFP